MLIGFAVGAFPSGLTVPVTEPAVAASTDFPAAGAEAAGAGADDSSFLLPPQPMMASASKAESVRWMNLVFIASYFLLYRTEQFNKTYRRWGRVSSRRKLLDPITQKQPAGRPRYDDDASRIVTSLLKIWQRRRMGCGPGARPAPVA